MAFAEVNRLSPAASARAAVYWQATAPYVRRAFSLQDCNPRSATYGCCDRQFWQYRTISGFAAATMQQLALPFAVLFANEFPGNEWHDDAGVLDRARAAMLFWARLQHPSGAFDEWYRNEHSYCATAFTTFGISEVLLRLRPFLSEDEVRRISHAISRAARWLSDRFNGLVMNQNLASCAALWNAYECSGDTALKHAFDAAWTRTLGHQDAEGWFPEYGGADVGYSLLALDLLACLYARGWSDALSTAKPLCSFLASFGYPASDFAGGLGSRGTEHAFAYGAEVFAPHIPEAAILATHLRSGLIAKRLCRPESVDDRYLAYFYLPSYVLTASLGASGADAEAQNATAIVWPSAGFRIRCTPAASLVCSLNRMGAFAICTAKSIHRNFGYWAETTDGRRWASCGWRRPDSAWNPQREPIEVSGRFVAVDDSLPLVRGEAAFRFVTQRLFRWSALAEFFHRHLTARTINRRRYGPFSFSRALVPQGEDLIVRDEIRRIGAGANVRSIAPTADIDVHSPSSRMSGSTCVDSIAIAGSIAEAWAQELNAKGRLSLTTIYQPDEAGQLRFVSIRIEER
jgi:hypothetical protein